MKRWKKFDLWTDDLVFVFHCDYISRDFSGSEWFHQQNQRRLSKYEGGILRQLRDCDCVDTNHYKDLPVLAKKELKIVGDVVRQYRGWVTLTLNNCSYAMVMFKTEKNCENERFHYDSSIPVTRIRKTCVFWYPWHCDCMGPPTHPPTHTRTQL